MKKQDRTISKINGKWANKRVDKTKASSTHKTQKEAYTAAKKMIEKQGGGEISIQGLDGKIREKNTISPGNDPYPPKG